MITLQGISSNIDKPLIGRISFSPVEKNKKSTTIIVNPKLSAHKLKDYAASISSGKEINSELKPDNTHTVCNVYGIDSLCEGDVVAILPSGKINILYQINSSHNIIFVTSRCNCNCIMCPQPINCNEGNLMDLNLKLISLIDKSTKELAFTGGEPTIMGHDLFRLILACKHFLPETSLLLLTNGRKFSDFEYTHLYSSLGHFNIIAGIALYGDNDIEHDFIVGSTGAFNESMMGILNLSSFGNPIELRTVIHKHTYKKLPRISEFIYRNMTFVKHIAFMGLEPMWRARKNLKQLWVEPEEFIRYLEESIRFLVQRGMSVSVYNLPLCLLPEHLWVFSRQSISEWKDSFDSKCLKCSVREKCSGIFDSGIDTYTKYLRPIL